jgi:hypothetical protein
VNDPRLGVTFYEADRLLRGPFALRIGGTSEFVSKIDPDDPRCFPPGSVETVHGWRHQEALLFHTFDEAFRAAEQAWNADGCHISIEVINED